MSKIKETFLFCPVVESRVHIQPPCCPVRICVQVRIARRNVLTMPSSLCFFFFFFVSYRGSHTEIFYKTNEQQKKGIDGIDIFWGRKEKSALHCVHIKRKRAWCYMYPPPSDGDQKKKKHIQKVASGDREGKKKIQQFLGWKSGKMLSFFFVICSLWRNV